jgi:hypothetical protein
MPASKVTQTLSEPGGLCLSQSGVEGSPKTLLGRSGRAFLILALTATKTTSGPVGCVYLTPALKRHLKHLNAGRAAFTSFRRRRPPRPLLGRSGCAYLIPASKSYQDRFGAGRAVCISLQRRRVTKNTFRPVGLRLPHSGVDGHQDHFWAGQAVCFSFRRRMSPTPLSGRSG